jgi:hypothetical protein
MSWSQLFKLHTTILICITSYFLVPIYYMRTSEPILAQISLVGFSGGKPTTRLTPCEFRCENLALGSTQENLGSIGSDRRH